MAKKPKRKNACLELVINGRHILEFSLPLKISIPSAGKGKRAKKKGA
jgi:hypothetical protein